MSTSAINLPIIECEVTFLSAQEGGRERAFPSGALSAKSYRPHVVVGDPNQRAAILIDGNKISEEYLGVVFCEGPDRIEQGKPVKVRLGLMYHPNVAYQKLVDGATFTIREGAQIVGFGRVTSGLTAA